MIRRPLFRRLANDERGNTLIEFAIVAPVMIMSMMALGDLSYQVYAQSILDGAIQKAARDSAIQGGANQTAALDEKVMSMVRRVAYNATYTSSRKSYTDFTKVGPEPFTDKPPYNGVRDPGECYQDINGNNNWDSDPGKNGQGGASDVTLYRIVVTYPRLFPVARFIGGADTQTISAKTLVKNQPYASQAVATVQEVCS